MSEKVKRQVVAVSKHQPYFFSRTLTVLQITGANGTIGYACVIYALEAGYRVRCIVRRKDAFSPIWTAPAVQWYLEQLEHTIVPDNTVDGAYNAALTGADYVIHTAGVWPLPVCLCPVAALEVAYLRNSICTLITRYTTHS